MTGVPTDFAVVVDIAKWTAASIEIFIGETSAAVLTRLTGARMIAVVHVDTGQCFLEQFHRPLVDHHLHSLSVVVVATSSSSTSSSIVITHRMYHNVGNALITRTNEDDMK